MPASFKISSHQLMILILLYSVGTVILHTPSPLAGFAKQDAWLAALFGTGVALIFVWFFIKTFWMPDTPLVALNILLAVVVILTARLGIETFTRTLEIFFIPVLILLTIFLISVIPQANVQNIQPVLENDGCIKDKLDMIVMKLRMR
ncbi:GerAB/ArcD/ProY family transporter [Peribacillus sp. RS7]|uniref:GerAB/ArcD/ProY family transporter n=1 Tax=Peribacillus sp. RS7 TaxID=3242679 RepID=UPI0035C0051E